VFLGHNYTLFRAFFGFDPIPTIYTQPSPEQHPNKTATKPLKNRSNRKTWDDVGYYRKTSEIIGKRNASVEVYQLNYNQLIVK